MTDWGYSHGNGMNGHGSMEAIASERRFTLLEVGLSDHSRRISALEGGHRELESHVRRRDRSLDKLISDRRSQQAQPQSATSKAWKVLLSQAAQSAGQWIGGILAMAYVMKGGDALTALQTLAKLF